MKWLVQLVVIACFPLAVIGASPPTKSNCLLTVFVGNDTTINCKKLIELNAKINPSTAAVTYQWKLVSASTPATYTATSNNKKTFGLNFSGSGVYVFSVLVTETATGAEARDEITITVNCGGVVNPPPPPPVISLDLKYIRGFSPNNDGINDTWDIEGAGGVENLTINIYDQHGRLVISIKNPIEDVIWDGKVNGKPMPVDTYYFVVLKDGKKILGDNFALLR